MEQIEKWRENKQIKIKHRNKVWKKKNHAQGKCYPVY